MSTSEISESDEAAIRKLAEILSETQLSEIEVERNDMRIRVARQFTTSAPSASFAPSQHGAPSNADTAPPVSANNAGALTSPMVGTAYMSPAPDKPPFVDIGSTVTAGQTVMIVEAMKTMNNIPAARSGKVVEILVEDGQPVEFGEPLMIIE